MDDDEVTSEDLDALDDEQAAELLDSLPEGFEEALDATPPVRHPVWSDVLVMPAGAAAPSWLSAAERAAARGEPDPGALAAAAARLRADLEERAELVEVLDELPDADAAELLDALSEEPERAELLSTAREGLRALDGVREIVDTGSEVATAAAEWRETLRRMVGAIR